MILQDKDIDVIRSILKRGGVFDSATLAELVDHYCTEVESHMKLGVQKEVAIQYVLNEINFIEMRKINRHAVFRKIKKPITMIILIACFAQLFLQINYSDSQTVEMLEEPAMVVVSINEEPPYLWPLKSTYRHITSSFGKRMSPFTKQAQHHKGIDIKSSAGTSIIAPADAIVLEVGEDDRNGRYIILRHDEIYQTKYCHLSETAVVKGQDIDAGNEIGKVGNSGLSTRPHLHYEVMKNGEHVDPKDYLTQT